MTGKYLKYLTVILNSKLFVFLMNLIVGTAAGGNAGNADNVKNLNVIIPDEETEKSFLQMLENKEFEQIDRAVYQMYGLSEEEIAFIETN